VRGFYLFLATILVTLFFCVGPGSANVVAQQKPGDSTQEMAEQMTETLRRLPEELYRALGKQPAQQSTRKAKEDSDQSSLQASIEASLQASLQAQDPAAVSQSSQQSSQQSSGQQSQGTGQEQGERPRVQLPQDKPLGAAGPNRNKKPGPEDADFIIIQDRWRAGIPEDPRFRKGSIFDPYHQNVLKGD
jgi:hypothetical protein